MLLAEPLTDRVIGLAIEVHRHTGPGLLESIYEQCLCRELTDAGIAFARQVAIPILYKGIAIGDGFKADIIRGTGVDPGNQSRRRHPANSCSAAPDISANERHPRRSAAELQRATPGGWPASLRRVGHVEANDFPQ